MVGNQTQTISVMATKWSGSATGKLLFLAGIQILEHLLDRDEQPRQVVTHRSQALFYNSPKTDDPRCIKPVRIDRDFFERQWWGDG